MYSDNRLLRFSRQSRVHRCYPPPKFPACAGGVMFYDADYPDAVNLGFQGNDRPVILIFLLPTP